jgi:hypothetical protein
MAGVLIPFGGFMEINIPILIITVILSVLLAS